MAADTDPAHEISAHSESYDRFIGWLKIGAIASAVVAAFVIFLITR